MRHQKIAVLTVCVLAALAMPASASSRADHWARYPYTVVDPGTLGGPQSFLDLPGVPLTPQGALLGTADTATPDPSFPNTNPFIAGEDPYIAHAFAWHRGRLRDLGALPGNTSSAVFEVNDEGVGAGASTTTIHDPFTGWPAEHAVVFKRGRVFDLGTLPGGYESQALAINDRGEVAGFASNAVPDHFTSAFFGPGWTTQVRSFIWRHGVMRDLGTLGGPDAPMTTLNARGQVLGASYTDSTPTPAFGVPTLHPYVWQRGRMQDLGSLGGTFGVGNWMNDAGEVVGFSYLAGDQTAHPFLWDGRQMRDLGTLGGDFASANWIDDAGDVAGWSIAPDQTVHGFLWRNGRMRDLPPTAGAAYAFASGVNAHREVVGDQADVDFNGVAPVLWSHRHAYDLSTLIAPTDLRLTEAAYIDDHGEIVAAAMLPDG
jgi:probable HAF family extracellular repeat protein